jgi:Zn-dependent peptidase ImmA (M78 family)
MTESVSGINPELLVWARKRSGQTLEDVAAAMSKDVATIQAWEAGTAAPTYVQLETLAYRVFKRPVALFFFPEPPAEVDPEHSFRTLPDVEIRDLAADTRHKVREARAMQLSLSELTEGKNPARRQILNELTLPKASPAKAAATVRAYLDVDLKTQVEEWKDADEALREWRSALEGVGVFVFKDSFKQKDVSGFSLHDSEFPVIFVNNSTAATRQIFTLFHELGHLLFHVSGVTKEDDSFIDLLHGADRDLEVFCNRFAAEFLIPSEVIRAAATQLGTDDEVIRDLAASYKVSREVVLRRLVDLGFVSNKRYEKQVGEWKAEYEKFLAKRKEKGGGNYYNTQATYLSDAFAQLVFAKYYRGNLSIEDVAQYLNVSAKSVPGIENAVLRKVTS